MATLHHVSVCPAGLHASVTYQSLPTRFLASPNLNPALPRSLFCIASKSILYNLEVCSVYGVYYPSPQTGPHCPAVCSTLLPLLHIAAPAVCSTLLPLPLLHTLDPYIQPSHLQLLSLSFSLLSLSRTHTHRWAFVCKVNSSLHTRARARA